MTLNHLFGGVTLLATLLLSGCNLTSYSSVSKKIPEGSALLPKEKIFLLDGLGGTNYIYRYRPTQESEAIIRSWWEHSQKMGRKSTNAWYPPVTTQGIRISSNIDVFISSCGRRTIYLITSEKGKASPIYSRPLNKNDQALFQLIREQMRNQAPLSKSESMIVVKKYNIKGYRYKEFYDTSYYRRCKE